MPNVAEHSDSCAHRPLLFLAAALAAVGIFCTGWLVLDVWRWHQVQAWREVAATIEHVELLPIRGRTGAGHRAVQGGTTYKVKARYRYTVGGKVYTGERVTLYGGSDNVGSFQHDKYRQLKRHLDRGEPITAFVKPRDPSDAVLFRELRWSMVGLVSILAGVFGGFGIYVLAMCLTSQLDEKRNAALERRFPHEPWRWREDWAHGRIESAGRGALRELMVAVLWNLALWPGAACLFADPEIRQSPSPVWLLLIFPAAGLVILLTAVYRWWQLAKYGTSTLELAAVPSLLGGRLAGLVRIPRRMDPASGFRVRLCAILHTIVRERPGQQLLWQDEQRVERSRVAHDAFETVIPVDFAIPDDATPTSAGPPVGDPVQWRLEVSAEDAGMDYKATFEVPVF